MAIKTLQKIRERLEQRPEELKQARQNGAKVIGWSGYNVPEELLYALGLIPIRIAIGGDDRLVEIGARYISTRNCVYTREILGLIEQNQNPYIQNVDAYAFDATCLQTYRVAELVKFYFKKEVFVLGVPRNFYWKEAKDYFVHEAEDFTKALEEEAGARLDPRKLADAIELYNQIRENLKAIYAYQAAKDSVLPWEDAYDLIQAGYFLDRKEYLALLQETLAELKALQPELTIEPDEDEVRIFLSGSIIPPGDRKLIHIIQDLGGRIVGDDLWSGILPYLDVDIEENTVGAVAMGYLNRTPHAALPYLDLKTDKRLKKLHDLIGEAKADGVIFHTLRYCDPFSFKAKETKDVLAESGTPLLEIHTEYAGSDYEAIRTRVEAFIEMLRNRNLFSREVQA
ncbi:MAG: 2-hydroxyacyl-CoA dehydratase family protein [Ethanoligenens sp.]